MSCGSDDRIEVRKIILSYVYVTTVIFNCRVSGATKRMTLSGFRVFLFVVEDAAFYSLQNGIFYLANVMLLIFQRSIDVLKPALTNILYHILIA